MNIKMKQAWQHLELFNVITAVHVRFTILLLHHH